MATLVEQAEGKGLKLELTRVIKASKQRVFDTWTRPEFVRQWFGSGEGRECSAAEVNLRAGEAYMFEMKISAGRDDVSGKEKSQTARVRGRYIKVEPYDLLVFTWRADWNPEEESLVTVALRDVDGGTELKLSQERFKTEESRDQHQYGWTGPLDTLVRVAESQ